MPYPIRLERDTPIIDWAAYIVAWCTTDANPNSSIHAMRSDGLIHPDYGTMDCLANTEIITARLAFCNGLHIQAPLEGLEFTPYQISAVAMHEDDEVRPFVFMGESPAVLTSLIAGDSVTDVRFLSFGDSPNLVGSKLEYNETILVKQTPNLRSLAFGIGMTCGGTDSLNAGGFCRLSVRRLVGVAPDVYDTTKL